MTKLSDIGPLQRFRRGVSIGALLFWMLIAAAAGAVAWDLYGNEVRTRLGVIGNEAPAPSVPAPTNDEVVALLKDLQAAQKVALERLEAVGQFRNSEQAASKAMSDSLAALGAKLDALLRPTMAAAKKPSRLTPRKPPAAAPRPLAPGPEPEKPEQPPADAAPPRP